MKKRFYVLISISLLGIAASLCWRHWKPPETVIINPEPVCELDCDFSVFYDPDGPYYLSFLPNSEVSWWCQIWEQDQLESTARQYGLDLRGVSFDFETETCYISFGRQLTEVRYVDTLDSLYYGYLAQVTFAADYESGKAYVYRTPPPVFVPFESEVKVFREEDGQRVFWGWLPEINQHVPTGHSGI